MSAIILIRFDHAIHLYTDGGLYRSIEDFAVVGHDSKVVILPHISTVISSVGTGDMRGLLHYNYGSGWASFDNLTELIKAQVEALRNERRHHGLRTVGVFAFGGWSESRERFETYTLRFDHDQVHKPEPAPLFCYMPVPDNAALTKLGLAGEVNIGSENCTEQAVRFMQAQRETAAYMGREGDEADDAPQGHTVGCFVQETILYREAAITRIVHRWPDEIGKLIDVGNDPPLPDEQPEKANEGEDGAAVSEGAGQAAPTPSS